MANKNIYNIYKKIKPTEEVIGKDKIFLFKDYLDKEIKIDPLEDIGGLGVRMEDVSSLESLSFGEKLRRLASKIKYVGKILIYGHSGTVVKVEPIGEDDRDECDYNRDNFGSLPSRVIFRNELGELVERLTPLVFERKCDSLTGDFGNFWTYKEYKLGDRFP